MERFGCIENINADVGVVAKQESVRVESSVSRDDKDKGKKHVKYDCKHVDGDLFHMDAPWASEACGQ